jgi:hypothetical protein
MDAPVAALPFVSVNQFMISRISTTFGVGSQALVCFAIRGSMSNYCTYCSVVQLFGTENIVDMLGK